MRRSPSTEPTRSGRPTRRRRRGAAALALAVLTTTTTATVLAGPAHAADFFGRFWTVAGHMNISDVDSGRQCDVPFAANTLLHDDDTHGNDARSFTFRRRCGDITAEVFIVGRLRDNNFIDTSGWVRVSERTGSGTRELAWRAFAEGFAPDFEQHSPPATFGDPDRGLVTFEWIDRNEATT
jgi:hypothetical protein